MKPLADDDAVSTGTVLTDGAASPAAALTAVPVRHPWRWVAIAVVVVLAAMLVSTLLTNPNFEWGVVRQYLTSETIINGLLMTLLLTVLAMVVGVVLGIVLAVMRLSPNPVLSGAAWALHLVLPRHAGAGAADLLVQPAGAVPAARLGHPVRARVLVTSTANALITPFVAALLGLGLNEAAYMAEIVRAGILSSTRARSRRPQALGHDAGCQTMRRIVLPQAMRVIIPPTGNETISMLKTTSLVASSR